MTSANFMGSTYYENGKDVWLTSSLKLKKLVLSLRRNGTMVSFQKVEH